MELEVEAGHRGKLARRRWVSADTCRWTVFAAVPGRMTLGRGVLPVPGTEGEDSVCVTGSQCGDVHSPTAIASAHHLRDFVVREDLEDANQFGNTHEGEVLLARLVGRDE